MNVMYTRKDKLMLTLRKELDNLHEYINIYSHNLVIKPMFVIS